MCFAGFPFLEKRFIQGNIVHPLTMIFDVLPCDTLVSRGVSWGLGFVHQAMDQDNLCVLSLMN